MGGLTPVRYDGLDALRGFAALMVVFHHCFRAFENTNEGLLWWLDKTPLRLLVSGRPAVILFFVLSGFVLALSLERGMTYRDFVVRRFCRIYVPFAASILLAAMLYAAADQSSLAGYAPWFNRHEPLTLPLIAGHLLMYGDAQHSALNPVIWSLVYELRISLIFPLIMWAAYRFETWRVVAGALAAALVAYAALRHLGYGPREFHFATSPAASLALTVHFALYFVLGAVLAKHREQVALGLAPLSPKQRFALFAGAAPLLLGMSLLITDITLGIFSALLIALVINGGTFTNALMHSRPAVFLGRVSYSLYLMHLPLFYFAAQAWFGNTVPMTAIWFVWPVLALIAAAFSFRLLEAPSMELGRRLTARRAISQEKPLAQPS